MQKNKYSETAMAVAAYRYAHLKYEKNIIFTDKYAEKFLNLKWKYLVEIPLIYRLVNYFVFNKLKPSLTQILLRAVFFEYHFAELSKNEIINQVVIMSAGFDSFAWRWGNFNKNIQLFELDYSTTQDEKKKIIKKKNLPILSNQHFIAVDFEKEDLILKLRNSEYIETNKSIFSWLGSSMYLTKEANKNTLIKVHQIISIGSYFIMDFGLTRLCLSEKAWKDYDFLKHYVAQKKEPIISEYDFIEFQELVKNIGFEIIKMVSPQDNMDYCITTQKNLKPLFSSFVLLKKINNV